MPFVSCKGHFLGYLSAAETEAKLESCAKSGKMKSIRLDLCNLFVNCCYFLAIFVESADGLFLDYAI